jgi:tetratricopeptide (TPR) repeat protein
MNGKNKYSREVLFYSAILFTAVFAVYGNTFSNPFIFDDTIILKEIPGRTFYDVVFHSGWRPLLMLSLYINYHLTGGAVWSYHLLNILFHTASVTAFFFLVLSVVNLSLHRWRLSRKEGILFAFTAALLWGVHPLNTESVTYMVQRCEAMMGFFFILTLLFYTAGHISGKKFSYFYLLSFLSILSGFAAKEAMIAIFPVVIVFDAAFLTSDWRDIFRKKLFFWALIVFLLFLPALFSSFLFNFINAAFDDYGITVFSYAVNQPSVILHYIALSFYPVNLCFDYVWSLKDFNENLPYILIVFFLILSSLYFFIKNRLPAASLGVIFFLLLAPRSSFVPRPDSAVEHRMYLPLVALILTVLSLFYFFRHRYRVKVLLLVFLPVALILGILTFMRNKTYSSAFTIWKDTVEKVPLNPRALNYLGIEYHRKGKYDKAEKCFKRALEIFPDYDLACNNLGNIYALQNKLDQAEIYYKKAISVNRSFADAMCNLSKILVRKGQIKEAYYWAEKAYKFKPGEGDTNLQLGKVYLLMGKKDKATEYFVRAAEAGQGVSVMLKAAQFAEKYGMIDYAGQLYQNLYGKYPDNITFAYKSANFFLLRRKLDEAEKILKNIIKKNPDFHMAYNDLGVIARKRKNLPQAEGYFRKAVSVNQDYTAAHFNLGLLYYQEKRYSLAYKQFKTALEQIPDNKKILKFYNLTAEKLNHK